MSGLVGPEDSDDSLDSEEDESDEPTTRPGSPKPAPPAAAVTPASGSQPGEKRERPDDMQEAFVAVKRANVPIASLLSSSATGGPRRPDEVAAPANDGALRASRSTLMQLCWTSECQELPAMRAEQRARLSSPRSCAVPPEADVAKLTPEDYASIVTVVRTKWPLDPLGQPLQQRRLKDVIAVVKGAWQQVLGTRMSNQMIKDLLQVATKGSGPSKPVIFRSAGRTSDGKTTFNLVV
jgi:hypothetical protein